MAFAETFHSPTQEGIFSMRASHTLNAVAVMFDDDHAVANAGLVLTATVAQHLGLEAIIDGCVDLADRPGYYRPGRKALTLIHSMVAGGDCIDDADVLRCGSTAAVLGHQVMAPSTLGTFLRSFSFGNVRQLDRASELALTGAWAAGAGPGAAELIIDIDSSICEVYGYDKQGAAYGYTHVLGYHPLLATRADTGEVLHCRQRKGSANTARGAQRFVRETIGRARRAGATGPIVVRADSGYCSNKVMKACTDHHVRYSITARQTSRVVTAEAGIDPDAWVLIRHPDPDSLDPDVHAEPVEKGQEAWVAETDLDGRRLIVRRTLDAAGPGVLFDTWRHHAFYTDRTGTPVDLDADHRRHAVIELVIRDLKAGAGMNHFPSGDFSANGAWLVLATLAHNLIRWTANLAFDDPGPQVAKTFRRRYLTLPGRLTHSARHWTLHLPTRWPWATQWGDALNRLRRINLTS